MAASTVRGIVRKVGEDIPGTAIAAMGVALAIYAFEANRMASFQNVPSPSVMNSVSQFASVAVLVALALCYRARPSLRIHRHPLAGFAIAGLLSSSLLLMSEITFSPPSQICLIAMVLSGMAKSLLSLCWVEALIPFRGRQYAVILALALAMTGVLNCFSAFIKQDAVMVLVAMIPLFSAACLYWFKDKQDSFDAPLGGPLGSNGSRRRNALKEPGPYSRGLVLIFLAPLPLYTFSFGFIHYAWVPFQDGGGTSLVIQMAAGLGTALAGAFLLLLISYFWGPKKLELYNMFILFLLGVTLYVSTMFSGMMPGLYIVPLNVAQKTALFLVFLAPFLVPAQRSSLAVAAIASALYSFGRGVTILAAGQLAQSAYSTAVLGAILLAGAALVTGMILNGNVPHDEMAGLGAGAGSDDGTRAARLSRAAISGAIGTPANQVLQGSAPAETRRAPGESAAEEPPLSEEERVALSCDTIARSHGLTGREREILQLLARGMTAGAIAEELTVSTSTVKTHMRNVYAKLDIHTQNELLIMVHRG